jgi:hypothetical protein
MAGVKKFPILNYRNSTEIPEHYFEWLFSPDHIDLRKIHLSMLLSRHMIFLCKYSDQMFAGMLKEIIVFTIDHFSNIFDQYEKQSHSN